MSPYANFISVVLVLPYMSNYAIGVETKVLYKTTPTSQELSAFSNEMYCITLIFKT